MPANQVSGAVSYLVGSATALALSIGPEAAGGCQVRGIFPRLQAPIFDFISHSNYIFSLIIKL